MNKGIHFIPFVFIKAMRRGSLRLFLAALAVLYF